VRTRSALTVAALALACREPVGPAHTGSLTATLTGARSGQFNVSGTLGRNLRADPPPSYFDVYVDGSRLWLAAHRERDYYFDHLLVDIPDYHGVGTYAIRGAIIFWMTPLTDARFEIVAGELVIASATADRLVGTLTGTAVYQPPFHPEAPFDTLHIGDGNFDVPVGPAPLTRITGTQRAS
jgi:hypothetical protein